MNNSEHINKLYITTSQNFKISIIISKLRLLGIKGELIKSTGYVANTIVIDLIDFSITTKMMFDRELYDMPKHNIKFNVISNISQLEKIVSPYMLKRKLNSLLKLT